MTNLPGRNCPVTYRYGPAALAAERGVPADTVYAVGGLYGNPFALDAAMALASRERSPPLMVFNGDFHWFDTDPSTFAMVNRTVLGQTALRGNVETELVSDDLNAGCGCAYPDWVEDTEVERSNRIVARLRDTARALPRDRARLASLPMYRAAEVGGLRIGIVHGDADSLSGWGFSQESLFARGAGSLAPWFEKAKVRVFVSSHTCLPVATDLEAPSGRCALINNGAAGMPNFMGTHYGLITRIGVTPAPIPALYSMRLESIHIEALPLHYDHGAWTRSFLRDWPAGSDAHVSYFRRIESGPDYLPRQAVRGGFRLRERAKA
jgi:hypothetical protein